MSKSAFRVIAEGLHLKAFQYTDMPTETIDYRTLSLEEVKEIVKEEFGDVKDVEDVEAEKVDDWGDAELEKEVDWLKTLKIKEFFNPGEK